jgi:hypothetical protein
MDVCPKGTWTTRPVPFDVLALRSAEAALSCGRRLCEPLVVNGWTPESDVSCERFGVHPPPMCIVTGCCVAG